MKTKKKKFNKHSAWVTHLGNSVSIEGMSDEHLANTIQFITFHKTTWWAKMSTELKKEAKRRGLTSDFLARAPFPYKDGFGNYIVWDYKNGKPKVIGSYLRG